MWWDLAGSSLGDSPKESGSSLGTRREIAEKKTGGLASRLPEVAGVCGSGGQQLSTGKPPRWRVNITVPQNLGGGQLLTAGKPPIPGFFGYG
ncbi:hypothetical protein B296_00020331 [Ensete ventricosum]|uniref:Uncharacterized protein n=1 Tax=Ensete ventricosum TaxID=4639 RepID=A0A426ZI02_ENSVE|nr:hypothetical protein B296_00020331 [Ensete ventricosum]